MATPDYDNMASAPSFQLGDIYYTVFRHKWKIVLCMLAGLAAAYAYYKLAPTPYYSQAKLLIRYVVTEERSSMGIKADPTKSPDQFGETIMNTEREILMSLDLAEQVAKSIGPEKILAKAGGGNNPGAAAMLIQGSLLVDAPPRSSVILVGFKHPDPAMVQVVLGELVDSYLKRHVEIHLAAGMISDAMSQEADQLRAQLSQTEEELRKLMNNAGIISLEDAKKGFGDQIARLRQEIFAVQAQLAEQSSLFQDMNRSSSAPAPAASPEGEQTAPSADQISAYQKIAANIGRLQRREQDYLNIGFAEESTRVKEVRAQLAEADEQRKKLEAAAPGLSRIPAVAQGPANPNLIAGAFNPGSAAAQISGLKARVRTLNEQLDMVRAEAAKVDNLETSILELRRRKELEEANYRNISASLKASQINERLGTGRPPNIIKIEAPTPPTKNTSKVNKTIGMIAVGGIFVGLGWAFFLELYLDRSIRRPTDIERTLRLPLFLSIPKTGSQALLPSGTRSNSRAPMLTDAAGSSSTSLEISPSRGAATLALNPFYETLRDRLINYFDSLNIRHKPKLVAVTGMGKDSGVTTIAAGLARSFSETGEGNVLLVDMTQGQGSAQHFHKGATVVGLEQLLDTKDSGRVQDNLYVVSENSSSDRLAKGMPQRFNQLIPKLKASDFDYIIFDMPPVNQISITPRLASFMDMMLLVVEAEKTDRDLALQASAMLLKSKTPVGVVLNKTKSYIPTSIHQDRDSLLGS